MSITVLDKILNAIEEKRVFWSFEYFPPKTKQGVHSLYEKLDRMYDLGPEFIDVTWGAGGGTSDLTLDICRYAQEVCGLVAVMHLTCTNMPRDKIDVAIERSIAHGLHNVLALRGDPPLGESVWKAVDTGFEHAVDLVKYLQEKDALRDHGICLGVAGYPECHIECLSLDQDINFLKQKLDAGAKFVITQLFYDTELFVSWYRKCREAGISCPVIPGMMPIQSYAGFIRMTTLCKTVVPSQILKDLEAIQHDEEAVKKYGVQLTIKMCQDIRQRTDCLGFHFYTLNQDKSVALILQGLGWKKKCLSPLPFRPSLLNQPARYSYETSRPIFWKHRSRSYELRTQHWPWNNKHTTDGYSKENQDIEWMMKNYAFKSYTDILEDLLPLRDLQISHDQHISIQSRDDLLSHFTAFYSNKEGIFIPWRHKSVSLEETQANHRLIQHCLENEYWVVHYQPAANGHLSPWGHSEGLVYQKAYLECFTHKLDELRDTITKINQAAGYNRIVYFASGHPLSNNRKIMTNISDREKKPVCTVSWGVFPGQQVIQPWTMSEHSFLAWREEAFAVWKEWEAVSTLLASTPPVVDIVENFYLVSLVDNDFVGGDLFDCFS